MNVFVLLLIACVAFQSQSALEALAHLHEMRISHRDIKPENYIVAPYRVDEDGRMVQRLVTIDFGLG